MKIKNLFLNGVQQLKEAGIPEPELEVSLLVAHLLSINRTALLLDADRVLDEDQREKFGKIIARRLNREPLAYILKEKEFWSLPFTVSKDVLIPRPETELLIEITLKTIKNQFRNPEEQRMKILDLGTGSGIIAVIFALELPTSTVTAVDLSCNALKVAKHNARRHEVSERIHFINCDWFGGISASSKFDLVLANPPYIERDILEKPFGETCESLQPEVGSYEPHLALDGGERGIQSISKIAEDLGERLHRGGWFFMEIGAGQGEDVLGIFRKTASYDNIIIHNDYAGLPRLLQARKQ